MIESLLMFFIHDALFLLGYLARGSAFPKPLSREEEAEMIARMQQGDERARETLIEHNLRLAAHIARKYTVPGYESDDLISIGTVGLIKGVGTFKPGTGTQLSTYCARCIENEILMCLRASQKRKGDVSLQEPIGMDGEGNEITLIDVLGTEPEAVHGEVERRVSLQSIRKLVDQSLKGGNGYSDALWADGWQNLCAAGGGAETGRIPFVYFADRKEGARTSARRF